MWQLGVASCLLKLKTEWEVGQRSFSPDTRSFITDHGHLVPECWPFIVEVEDSTRFDAHQHGRDSPKVITYGNERGSIQDDNGENGGDSTEDDDNENQIDRAQSVMDRDEAVDVPFTIGGYGIGFENAWLTKDGERIIWLPPEHRPSSLLVTESRYSSVGPFVQYGHFP